MAGLNPVRAASAAVWALRVSRPSGDGTETIDHGRLSPVLASVARRGGLDNVDGPVLRHYIESATSIDPTCLTRDDALSYWLNVHNALAIELAVDARDRQLASVLHLKSGFERIVATIGGERVSLMDIEHGKIRRFKDPRIHGSLVCGSLSCPTLRPEPFDGSHLDEQLDDQMRQFLAAGGAVVNVEAKTLSLSRVFLWYGSDFARPRAMPTFLPAARRSVARAVMQWLDSADQTWFRESEPTVEFQDYDWGLDCAVG